MVDPSQLELAILNLCVNARDAMPRGGVLTIAAEPTTLGPGELAQVSPGLYVKLSVIDTGLGMDEQTLARAVEPFYSTKEVGKGTGLGLSMVHGLASQMGGGFRLTSAPGQGARVDLWLPVAADGLVAPQDADSRVITGFIRPLSILLVDDEQLVRTATAEMLRELGHSVLEAGGGAEALGQVAEHRFDLVVTDYKMPRMNGAELAERIKEERPSLPVLLITGYTGLAEDAPNLPRLDKPFRRAELAAAMHALVGGRQCRRSAEAYRALTRTPMVLFRRQAARPVPFATGRRFRHGDATGPLCRMALSHRPPREKEARLPARPCCGCRFACAEAKAHKAAKRSDTTGASVAAR